MGDDRTDARWLDGLSGEDRAFLKRFLLSSGSLKDLARAYGVSYPTIRLRLDRLMEKVRILDAEEVTGEFERRLRVAYAEGRLDMETMKELLAAYRKEVDRDDDANDRDA